MDNILLKKKLTSSEQYFSYILDENIFTSSKSMDKSKNM
jgi:hypothetical protein